MVIMLRALLHQPREFYESCLFLLVFVILGVAKVTSLMDPKLCDRYFALWIMAFLFDVGIRIYISSSSNSSKSSSSSFHGGGGSFGGGGASASW